MLTKKRKKELTVELDQRNIISEHGTSVVQKARKWSEKDGNMSRGLRSQLESQQNNFEQQNE